jgi:hypothetical protein
MQSEIIPAIGLLANIWIYWTGTVTTGSGTPSGSLPSGIPESPWNIIKNIRLHSTAGVDIINCSGRALAAYNRTKTRANMLSANAVNDFSGSNIFNNIYKPWSGAVAASTPYTISGWLKIPIMTDDWLMWGMLLLQNDNVRLYLDITLGTQSDICGTVSGVSLTPAFTVSTAVEFFSVDDANPVLPNLGYVRTLIEEIYPFASTGDIVYQPPRGNVYIGLGLQFVNNGSAIPNANINSCRIVYAGNVTPYQENYLTRAMINFNYTGIWDADGYIHYDFADGYGVPEIVETRDFMDTNQQTDFRIIPNVTGITPTNAYISVMKDQIGEARQ